MNAFHSGPAVPSAAAANDGEPEPFAVILGRADDMRAEVHVRFHAGGDVGALRLAGTLTGPRCGTATTLPTVIRLVDTGMTDAGPAARAILTEPSYWTPALPNLYQLDLQTQQDERPGGSFQRLVGLRRLGVRGRSLWLDGRRWVPRAVGCDPAGFDAAGTASAMHDAGLAVVMADPASDVCGHADAIGVAVIALLADAGGEPLDPDRAVAAIARWALHPSVVMAVLPRRCGAGAARDIAARARRVKQTMLLGMEVDGGRPPMESLDAMPAGSVDVPVVRLAGDEKPHAEWRTMPPTAPLVAWRIDAAAPLDSRRGCDRLQADLAAWAVAGAALPVRDWAGYMVSQTAFGAS